MSKRIIIEIGQTFSIYDDNNNLISKVKCVKDVNSYGCKSCVFETSTCNSIECDRTFRPDGVDVHFEYVTL